MASWTSISIIAALSCSASVSAQEPADYNAKIMDTVRWLAQNKPSLGYDLRARYTENLRYGNHVFRSTRGGKTMCVAAVFEVMIRAIADAPAADGTSVPDKLMPGRILDGSTALNVAPYVFQYKSNARFPEYKRRFSAGVGDALVLFGMGRYVTFATAKPGDFIYFNRSNGGHAVVFTNHLNASGAITQDPGQAVGFRYFSAQEGGTKGMGYRDAFFGTCPAGSTKYVKDCGLIRSVNRDTFSVSRMHDPKEWYTSYSAIRVERFFKGATIDQIYADEANFRRRGRTEQEDAERKAKEYARKGLFPLVVPPIAGESSAAEKRLAGVSFEEEFGPTFEN